MPVVIPFFDIARFSEEITLDGTPYRFEFDFNSKGSFWSMSVLNRDLETLVSGIKLVLNYSLFDQFPGRGLPPGQLYAIDTSDQEEKINRENIIDKIELVYVEEDEVGVI